MNSINQVSPESVARDNFYRRYLEEWLLDLRPEQHYEGFYKTVHKVEHDAIERYRGHVHCACSALLLTYQPP